ncbi:MAG: PPC domain-containing protein [Planctomycetes bacterium]|nr:PPC domain-containing protein [Planctomycetota bacterium]
MRTHLGSRERRWTVALLAYLCSSVFICGYSSAATPSLGSVTPRGGQRGKEVTFFFNGGRLSDAQEVLFYSPGFSVLKLEVVNDGQVKATVKIAEDCPPGEHAVRLRTKSGISELRTVWVGALPAIAEKEPNSEFDKPQKIPLNVTVEGVVDSEDVDYYAVELKKGQRLSVEIEAMRLGVTFFDPYIAILDSKRFELATSDDSPLNKQDGLCSIVAPADGTYVVQVRESAYGGNGACMYRLHVGTFPRPLAVVPAGGKAGEEVEVRFLGDPTGEIKQKIKLPKQADAKFGVYAQDAGGIAPSPIPFRVSEHGNVVEVEPNDTHATATKAELPLALNGVIDKPGDVDFFRFKAKKGETYDIHCYARRLGSPLDSVMNLYQLNGGALIGNDDAIGPDSYFRYTFPADGEYVLSITDHLGKGGPAYFYRVEFTLVQATTTVSIPKVSLFSQERQTIVVPRGNRFATLMSVGRGNWGGDAVFGADGLPAGIKLNAETVPAYLDVVPVVFEAAADAPVGGKLMKLTAHSSDPKQKVVSSFFQTVEFVISGPGQSVYWKVDVDQTGVAVVEEAPFKIQIIEPKVPLVLNGSMNLKIVAERQKGFTAAITIYPLFNPPGVGSASAVTIPANQNETVLPMNAAGNATVRKWKTAVLGVSDAGKGPVWVSSQLATIEVAPPLVTFNMERTASEQGKDTELFCKVQLNSPFQGKAKVTLYGLPPKVTTSDIEITKETKEFAFKLTVDKTSPAGQHRNLFCQVVFTQNGEPIAMNAGYSELRIDVPLPPKPNQPVLAKAPTPTPMPTPNKPPEKRLTRLEKLRLEQQEREKAGQGETTPPPKK